MDQQQLFIDMALHAWNTQISRTDKLIDSLTDEDLGKAIAPGKNSIFYILGHLIAVNDGIITLFGTGERSYAHLDEAFVKKPDNSGLAVPSAADLRHAWKKSNTELSALFGRMTADDWFSRHTAMTDDDYRQTPSRNKMSVLLNRTSHVAYHLGQLVLAK